MTAAGVEAVKAYLRRPLRVQGEVDYGADCPISTLTRKPRLYRRVALRDRLLPLLASMPMDFFRVVTEDRNVWFLASALPPGLDMPDPDAIGLEHMSRTVAVRPLGSERNRDVHSTPIDHWAVLLGRVAIELCDRKAFAGTVVHELCHVYLEHDLNLPDLTDAVWKRTENEAIALACEIGFREETEAQLGSLHALFGDGVETGNLPPQ